MTVWAVRYDPFFVVVYETFFEVRSLRNAAVVEMHVASQAYPFFCGDQEFFVPTRSGDGYSLTWYEPTSVALAAATYGAAANAGEGASDAAPSVREATPELEPPHPDGAALPGAPSPLARFRAAAATQAVTRTRVDSEARGNIAALISMWEQEVAEHRDGE